MAGLPGSVDVDGRLQQATAQLCGRLQPPRPDEPAGACSCRFGVAECRGASLTAQLDREHAQLYFHQSSHRVRLCRLCELLS